MAFGFGIKRNATDAIFSDYIREKANWRCEQCGKDFTSNRQSLHNSHFIGRGNKSTRWDIENCAALCFYHHRIFTENPHLHYQFFFNRLGEEKLNRLLIRSKLTAKDLKIDEKLLRVGFRQMLAELKSKIIGAR